MKLTTFDSINEVNKLAQYYHSCELVLRIRADDPTAELPLGSKYGANMEEVCWGTSASAVYTQSVRTYTEGVDTYYCFCAPSLNLREAIPCASL